MKRQWPIVLAAALVTALPFLFRERPDGGDWRPGDPEVVIISPHNEAIRYEFGKAFLRWHRERYGRPARVDWRVIGGTTEISRYLTASYIAAARAWWTAKGREWPAGAGDALVDRRFPLDAPPTPARFSNESDEAYLRRSGEERRRWEILRALYTEFRKTDDPSAFTSKIDLFFGGGEYDHLKARGEGLTVPPWPPEQPPAGLFSDAEGRVMIPAAIAGETWRNDTMFGNAVSTFGICFNYDRLRELGIDRPPSSWSDLADPRYFRRIGMADPTKSGSIAKAFELIVHQQCYEAVRRAGFSDADIDRFEKAIAQARLPPGEVPSDVPAAYQQAIERGWEDGIRLIQRIGANARYFTDSAGKVPIDVSSGAAAAGIAIDFYGRFQAQMSRAPDGAERMGFVVPAGGSGVSCDPISLLRGAPHREIAVRFIEFVLSEDGQKIWTYRPGTPGGPVKYALRRMPIRRTFYPSEDPVIHAQFEAHRRYTADDLADPSVNPYALAERFTYRPRWTSAHFGVHRDLIRAMCLNAAADLQKAWAAANRADPARRERALAAIARLPTTPIPLTWGTALRITRVYRRMDYLRDWTVFFRASYREAAALPATEGDDNRPS